MYHHVAILISVAALAASTPLPPTIAPSFKSFDSSVGSRDLFHNLPNAKNGLRRRGPHLPWIPESPQFELLDGYGDKAKRAVVTALETQVLPLPTISSEIGCQESDQQQGSHIHCPIVIDEPDFPDGGTSWWRRSKSEKTPTTAIGPSATNSAAAKTTAAVARYFTLGSLLDSASDWRQRSKRNGSPSLDIPGVQGNISEGPCPTTAPGKQEANSHGAPIVPAGWFLDPGTDAKRDNIPDPEAGTQQPIEANDQSPPILPGMPLPEINMLDGFRGVKRVAVTGSEGEPQGSIVFDGKVLELPNDSKHLHLPDGGTDYKKHEDADELVEQVDLDKREAGAQPEARTHKP